MLYILIILTFVTFITFGIDKRLAVRHRRRISESMLLILTFVGGTAGAVLAMMVFRHKISKKNFLLKIALIIALQFIITYFYWRKVKG
nr:DUF1294 domain-containing protein [uncultured Chryseobacterium sp.]